MRSKMGGAVVPAWILALGLATTAKAEVFVQAYARKDGTVVKAHLRSQGHLQGAAGLAGGTSPSLSGEDARKAGQDIQQALTGGLLPESKGKGSAEPVDGTGQGSGTGSQGDANTLQPPQGRTSLGLGSSSVPVPQPQASGKQEDRKKVLDHYGRIGKKVGSVLGGVLLGGMFFAAGAPSLVGAVSAGILGGYIGVKVGGAIGKAVGQGVAKAKLWLDKQGHNLKEHLGAVGRWWGNRPRWGKPYP